MKAPTATKSKPKFRRRPDHRPGQILLAAERVFGKYGYDATTLDRVAKAAGITKGTIYLYFSGKKDLYLQMMEYRLGGFIDEITQVVSEQNIGSFDELLGLILPRIRTFIKDPGYANFLRLMIAESGKFPEFGKRFLRNVPLRGIGLVSKAYEKDASGGKVKKLDPKMVMFCLVGMHIIFVLAQELLGGKEIEPMAWGKIEKTIDVIFRDGIGVVS